MGYKSLLRTEFDHFFLALKLLEAVRCSYIYLKYSSVKRSPIGYITPQLSALCQLH